MLSPLWIIDAHGTYQQGLDVPTLASEGYSGLIVKASEGINAYIAGQIFEEWITSARTLGMVPGAYHWVTEQDPVEQISTFLSVLDRVGGYAGLLVAFDVEDTSGPSLTYDTLCALTAEWNTRTYNYPFFLYSSGWWWNEPSRQWDGCALTPYLWDSRYVTGTGFASSLYMDVPDSWWVPQYGQWPRTTLLQFTSRAEAGGIASGVDASAFLGSMDELRMLTRHADTRPGTNSPVVTTPTTVPPDVLAFADAIGERIMKNHVEAYVARLLTALTDSD